jgi:hypothetical protein
MSIRPNTHRWTLERNSNVVLQELVGENKDATSPTAIRQWHSMYQSVTQSYWDHLNPKTGGPKLINLYCINCNVPEGVEMIIHKYHFSMIKYDLDNILIQMKNKVDVHSQLWANRMSAARACTNDYIMDRYFQLNLKLELRIWSLEEISIIIFRHISVKDSLFQTYLLNFQRRILGCTCGVCTGTWNNVHETRKLQIKRFCGCNCVLCDKQQYFDRDFVEFFE